MTTESPAGIDIARADDEADIIDLLRLKFEEDGGAGRFPLERIRTVVRRGIRNRGGCIGVIRGRKRIEASVGIFVSDLSWLTPDEHLIDRWNFVHPQHRRSDHGRKLIGFARWVAERCKRPLLILHVVNERTAAKCVLLEGSMGGAFAYLYIFDPQGNLNPRILGNHSGKAVGALSKNTVQRLTRSGLATGALAATRQAS